jgi:hypothetical protein
MRYGDREVLHGIDLVVPHGMSGAWFPISGLPHWLVSLAGDFPARRLTDVPLGARRLRRVMSVTPAV